MQSATVELSDDELEGAAGGGDVCVANKSAVVGNCQWMSFVV